MNKYKKIIVILFFVILLCPVLFINLKKDQKSKIDNKILPEIESITDMSSLEEYISKRIGFRENIINTYTRLNDLLFGKMVHPIYEYGKEGYVFFKMENEVLDSDFLDAYAQLVKNVQEYVEKHGSVFLYIVNPTKKSVYSNFLPDGYIYNDIRIKYLKEQFDKLEVKYLDNTDYLIEEAKNNIVFNKVFDAGHWNENGAFLGINNIYTKLKELGVNIDNLDKNDYNVTYKTELSLPVSEFKIKEDVPVYSLKNENYYSTNIDNDVIVDKNHPYLLKTTNNNSDVNLLIFRGSYFTNKEKFISPIFNEIYYVHNYMNVINFDYYYSLSNYPDVVLFDGVEYSTTDSYYDSNKILSKEYNVLYSEIKGLTNKAINNISKEDLINQYNDELNKGEYVTLKFESNDVKYAYFLVDDKPYDFTKDDNQFYITLEKNVINDRKAKIVFVDSNQTFKDELLLN